MNLHWNKYKQWLWVVSNKYIWSSAFFIIWMAFVDDSSLCQQIALSKENREARQEVRFYEEELEKLREEYDRLRNDPDEIKKIARERYYMKKEDEDIFVVVKQ